ncbi:PadR family transcriptional regulator [Gracilibacillus alcaliphilus]|uniref:PadR family transcriptional regulator n=1 Tax=Gracilibacillus alcaliphilus TaxID=1401441 RepID=UPI001958A620|nr:PadR family transcriptional regulator [Gracilibacillus alcaliphilus]
MHYILLALQKPLHGYGIMQLVTEMSNKEVNIAAGTLYGAIENLKKHGYIQLVSDGDSRKKVYQITASGREILAIENERLKHLVQLFEKGSDRGEKV